jgi:hypothetical protein
MKWPFLVYVVTWWWVVYRITCYPRGIAPAWLWALFYALLVVPLIAVAWLKVEAWLYAT